MIPEYFDAVAGGNTIRIDVREGGLEIRMVVSRKGIEELLRVLEMAKSSQKTGSIKLSLDPVEKDLGWDSRGSSMLVVTDEEGTACIVEVLSKILSEPPLEITPFRESIENVWKFPDGSIYNTQEVRHGLMVDQNLKRKRHRG